MQGQFSILSTTLSDIKAQLSLPRLNKYLNQSSGDDQKAMRLYRWNCSLSQSLYWPTQTLEVIVRNSISDFLKTRYGQSWHFEPRFHSKLEPHDLRRLKDAIDRQIDQRGTQSPAVDPVIADLSLSFWVSLLRGKYEVPLGWGAGLRKAFPYLPPGYARQSVYRPLDDARDLRNRIAHHEPIFHLKLELKYRELMSLIKWISLDVHWLVEQSCTFPEVRSAGPQ
jgi:hypothetical protein